MAIAKSEIANITRSIYQNSEDRGYFAVADTLRAIACWLPPGAVSQWAEVFRALGQQCPGTLRYDILLGIADAAESVPATKWIPLWVNAAESAKIHPVSHLLCAGPHMSLEVRSVVESVVLAKNTRNGWFGDIVDIRDIDDVELRGWILRLKDGAPLRNLVAAEPVVLERSSASRVIRVGEGCCFTALRSGVLSTKSLGTVIRLSGNAEVIGDIDAKSVAAISVGENCRVGGVVTARRILEPGFASMSKGIRWNGKTHPFNGFRLLEQDETLRDPIVVPESLGEMLHHIPCFGWMGVSYGEA